MYIASLVPKINGREKKRNQDIILPRPETEIIRNSLSYRGAIAWNSLDSDVTMSSSIGEFKRKILKLNTDQIIFYSNVAVTQHRDSDFVYFWLFSLIIVDF